MDITKYIDERAPQPDRPRFTRETQPNGPHRSRTIYISHKNDWILRALIRGKSQSGFTKDELADTVLDMYLDHHYPELAELYKQRQAIDNQAIKTAGEKSKL